MNPTFEEVMGITEADANLALTKLGLVPPIADARESIFTIIDNFSNKYEALKETKTLNSYTIEASKENIDIDTQRRTYTFTFDLSLVVGSVDDEAI